MLILHLHFENFIIGLYGGRMLQVNYDILPKRKQSEKRILVRSVHNSFYIEESHYEPNLSDDHGIFIDDYFGFQFSNEYDI